MPLPASDQSAAVLSPQQRHARTLRKLKSAHTLSSHTPHGNAPSLLSLQRQQQQQHQHPQSQPLHQPQQRHQPSQAPPQIRTSRSPQKEARDAIAPLVPALPSHGRSRSNSDAAAFGLSADSYAARSHAATKKMVVNSNKGLTLDVLVREGPRNGDIKGGLECMRYQVLSNGVGSDHDGMVCLSRAFRVASRPC